MDARALEVRALFRRRPRDRFLRGSLVALGAAVVGAWVFGQLDVGDLLRARRFDNLVRFVRVDSVPPPLRDGTGTLWTWAVDLWRAYGAEALARTAWIAIASIVLAALAASLPSFLGARALQQREPFADDARPRSFGTWFARAVRLGLVLLRAIPEYVWAFLLLALLGAGAWPAVLALVLHNAGILGRLGADTLENVERRAPRHLWLSGARRPAIAIFALAPAALGRLLAYVFYRWETCVREATVLGMLGVVSIGYYVQEARGRQRYDELLFLIALGAALVLAGEIVSSLARGWIRARERGAKGHSRPLAPFDPFPKVAGAEPRRVPR